MDHRKTFISHSHTQTVAVYVSRGGSSTDKNVHAPLLNTRNPEIPAFVEAIVFVTRIFVKKTVSFLKRFNIKHSSAESCCKGFVLTTVSLIRRWNSPVLRTQTATLPLVILLLDFCRLCCSDVGYFPLLAVIIPRLSRLRWESLQRGQWCKRTENSKGTREDSLPLTLDWRPVSYSICCPGRRGFNFIVPWNAWPYSAPRPAHVKN
jgi:hypothetical protein